MLRFKNYIAPSAIAGLGVFTDQDIPKDGLIWSFEEGLDRKFTQEQFDNFDEDVRAYLTIYGFRDALDGYYYLTVDNDRFTNHSENPNTYVAADGRVHASRDIQKGEEILTSYKDFDSIWEKKF